MALKIKSWKGSRLLSRNVLYNYAINLKWNAIFPLNQIYIANLKKLHSNTKLEWKMVIYSELLL